MSREDACAKPGCGQSRASQAHNVYDFGGGHAFVEPARAEAPHSRSVQRRIVAQKGEAAPTFAAEAPQGETCVVCKELGPMACADHEGGGCLGCNCCEVEGCTGAHERCSSSVCDGDGSTLAERQAGVKAAQPETEDEARVLAEAFLAQHERRLDDFCNSASKGEYGAGQIDYMVTDLVVDAVRFARAAENEACEKLARTGTCPGVCRCCDTEHLIGCAIAKRRGGGR